MGGEERFNGRRFIKEKMCRQARFTHVYERVRVPDPDKPDKCTRTWEAVELKEPRVGWIVGATWLQTGYRYPGFGGGYNVLGEWEDCELPGFQETEPRKAAYLITPWPTVRPSKVPPECVEVLDEPVEPHYWTEEMIALTRKAVKNWAREPDGRFAPEDPMVPFPDEGGP